MRLSLPALVGSVLVAFSSLAVAQSPETVKIGLSTPLSADLASFGKSVRDAVVLAADEINAKGGVLGGKKIELVIEDDQSKPDQAKTVFEKLIKRDKVVAIIGDVTSGCSMAAAPVAQAAGVPMLSPTATAEKLTKEGNCIFRSCFIDPLQAAAIAKFGMEDLKATKFAVLYNVKDTYSVGLKDAFDQYVKAHGGEIVSEVSYSSGDSDFAGQLTKIRKAKPDAIYAPGYYGEIGPICGQARELKINVPLLGSDGWDSTKTAELGGDAINGNYFTNHYSAEDQRPVVQNMIKAYTARYGKGPDALAVLGYEATYLMADAINRAGSADSSKIREALADTKGFQGVTGTITIGPDRNALKTVTVLKIENKQFRFCKTIDVQ
jgi:branched-chain amino acid transport system substrate-binding protein